MYLSDDDVYTWRGFLVFCVRPAKIRSRRKFPAAQSANAFGRLKKYHVRTSPKTATIRTNAYAI